MTEEDTILLLTLSGFTLKPHLNRSYIHPNSSVVICVYPDSKLFMYDLSSKVKNITGNYADVPHIISKALGE